MNQDCAAIREQGATMTTEQLKTLFDVFVFELKRSNTSSMDITLINEIVSALVNLPKKSKQLAAPELVVHQLMILLRDCVLVDQLRRRHSTDIAHHLLIDLSTLFANTCYHINGANVDIFKQLLFHNSLIDELASCFDDISTSGKHLDDPYFLKSIGLLLVAVQRFEKKQTPNDELSLITPLLTAVLKCLCSSYTVEALKGLERNFSQNLSERQILLLSTCPLFVQWFPGNRDPELFLQIPRALLGSFTSWVISCQPNSIIHCSLKLRDMMRYFNFILVRPIEWENETISSQEFYDDYCKLVSQWSIFLIEIVHNFSDESDHTSIARFCIQDLYNFTLHPNLLNYMKGIPTLISTLLGMTDIQQDETQLNTYRCLGKLMTEEDIKTMPCPSKIAMVYVKFVTNTIDDPTKKERFYSLLDSLKSKFEKPHVILSARMLRLLLILIGWVQHDQVKVHLIDQMALPLLVRSTMESKFDPIKVQKPALEILLALSFNNDAAFYLKENQNFMNHIRKLSSNASSEKLSLIRAAEGLLWKLEKETEKVAKPAILNSYQYDVMISYAHSDKQLCHRIHERLVKDGFRVWIDREHMHGATMVAMADAIENSDVVLICMSDAYKQSVYCQSEAHYAYERRRRLIPLIMKPQYKPDGWLGIIASGKIYVDFIKVEFNLAYEKLKSEIGQPHRCNTSQTTTQIKEKGHLNSSPNTAQPVDDSTQSIESHPAV